jgi:hypothetical protein
MVREMADTIETLNGVGTLICDPNGPTVRNDRDAVAIVGAALSNGCALVVLPVERLCEDFFDLKTRIAGEMLQKFVNYERRIAIVGDISRHLEASAPLRDFVHETNRGRQVWFVPDRATLEEKLKAD